MQEKQAVTSVESEYVGAYLHSRKTLSFLYFQSYNRNIGIESERDRDEHQHGNTRGDVGAVIAILFECAFERIVV